MALPNPENLAYRGRTSGNAGCMAYVGFICGSIITDGWKDAIRFTVFIKRKLRINVEL